MSGKNGVSEVRSWSNLGSRSRGIFRSLRDRFFGGRKEFDSVYSVTEVTVSTYTSCAVLLDSINFMSH